MRTNEVILNNGKCMMIGTNKINDNRRKKPR